MEILENEVFLNIDEFFFSELSALGGGEGLKPVRQILIGIGRYLLENGCICHFHKKFLDLPKINNENLYYLCLFI